MDYWIGFFTDLDGVLIEGDSNDNISSKFPAAYFRNDLAVWNSYHPSNISIAFTLCGDITPIPTLSQWGIIALGMLTMIFGVVMIRQRKVIFGS